ncbi:MAG: hypothetical protein A3G87_03465 [Omnitrophica bacterium RIFCSPLOWO2_12_FULL_50_11]|nr:MAG: hypothetical protein A3G87_03465 [Omnitrophica bacterium RIFCSPLOWO2_12_FULL_50_11]
MNVKRSKTKPRLFPLAVKAEKALKAAVAKAIREHALAGRPIYVWRNGKVVRIPASELKSFLRKPKRKKRTNR